jgi:hypothetical protein
MTKTLERQHAASVAPAWSGEMADMLDAYSQAGGDPSVFGMPEVATLVVSANQVLAAHEIPGVHFEAKPLEHGVQARLVVDPGTRVERPVHLCFGVIPADGLQEILAEYEIGEGAEVQFLAHCSFPNAVRVQHRMQARIHVGKNASLTYTEEHFHGQTGGAEVLPCAVVSIDDGGRFITTFQPDPRPGGQAWR